MKNQKVSMLFVVFALVVSGCSVPLASVKTRQSLPTTTPDGCYYVDRGGNEDSGNYVYANGYAYDAGTFFMQIAAGNSMMVMACSDAATQSHYGKMYDQYMRATYTQTDNDTGLKKQVAKDEAALKEVNENVLRLGELVATVKGGEAAPEKPAAPGKKGKDGKPQASLAPLTNQPIEGVAPLPVAKPAATAPSFSARVMAAKTRVELAQIITDQAQLDPGNARALSNLAITIGNGSDPDLSHDKQLLVENFGR